MHAARVDRKMLDKKQCNQAFNRAAGHYDQYATLQQAVANNLLERLQWLTIKPKTIADLGAGTGNSLMALQAYYPEATIIEMDIAEQMLKVNQSKHLSLGKVQYVCGDMLAIPLQADSMDLVISNLAIHWEQDIHRCFSEIQRILRPGGAFLFSTLGIDTLKECRQAWQAVDDRVHVHPFLDMHDVGDTLMQVQLSDPVMDVEYMTLLFDSVRQLAKTLKGLGVQNVHQQRTPGLTSRASWQQFEKEYEKCRVTRGLPVTYEVIYGIAWKPVQPQHRKNLGEVWLSQIGRK